MSEEPERAEGEIDHRADNNERDNPVAKLVEHRQAGTDENLDKVIGHPRYNGADIETSRRLKRRSCVTDECIHIEAYEFIITKGRPSLTSCRTAENVTNKPRE